nr:MarR family winged helix-turn-helix transcriptional regulator [Paenibacillus turpanensis]
MFQLLARNFGFLNERCCESCCGQELSLTQSHILYEIQRKHQPSMQDVSGALGIDVTTFSRQIKTLVDKGLVKKTPHPDDNRINILSLTLEGQQLENQINGQVNAQLAGVMSQLTAFERETVIRSIELLNKAMQNSGSCCVPPK